LWLQLSQPGAEREGIAVLLKRDSLCCLRLGCVIQHDDGANLGTPDGLHGINACNLPQQCH
jgi:hypothetical protein